MHLMPPTAINDAGRKQKQRYLLSVYNSSEEIPDTHGDVKKKVWPLDTDYLLKCWMSVKIARFSVTACQTKNPITEITQPTEPLAAHTESSGCGSAISVLCGDKWRLA
ncbi:MAG: hypothetical protein L7F78_17310 [Syntrophales bacterium LBB04]|nr:hypothetical protein [Syntrophales bacterium LBB04]